MLLATLSNNISAWNQCCTLNSSFHCSFRGLSGPQFQFGFYLWNLIWIILVSPSWHGGDPLWGCAQFWPLQLPKVQSSFMIIISPLLCGHNSPTFTQFWHSSHLMICSQPRFELQGGVGRLDPLLRAKLPGKSHFSIWRWLNLSIWRWLKWVTKMTTNSRSNNHRWLSE